MAARAFNRDATAAYGIAKAGGVTLERRDEAGREGNRKRRARREARARQKTVVVDEEGVRSEGERDARKAKPASGGKLELLDRHVERPDDGRDGPAPKDLRALDREKRREEDDTRSGREGADEIGSPSLAWSAQADREERAREERGRREMACEECRTAGAGEEKRGRDRRELHSRRRPRSSKRAS